MKQNKLFLLIAMIIVFNYVNAQIPNCGGASPATSATRTAGCTPTYPAYAAKYGRIFHHVPSPNITPIKTVNISFHFIQKNDGSNNWVNDQAHLNRLTQIVNSMNARMTTLNSPSDPIAGVTSQTDTKIRFEVTGVYFYQNDLLNNLIVNVGEAYKYDNYVNSIDPSRIKNSLPIYITHGVFEPKPSATAFTDYFPSESNLTQNTAIIGFFGYDAPANDNYVSLMLTHEFGHALDLQHTFEGSDYYPNKQVPDYLSDVFNTTWWNYCNPPAGPPAGHSCYHESYGDPYNNNLHSTNNLMGYSVMDYLSPLQLGFMHRALALKSVRKYVKDMNSSTNSLVVNQSEIWDFDIQMYQDILVTNGATLNIICKVGMAKNGVIKVDPGATLIVGSGLLTSWGSMWGGIVLSPGSKLIMEYNATIENALLAIDSKGGAIVSINGCKLNKNYRGIYLEPYAGTHPCYIVNSTISCVDASGNPINLLLSPKAGVRAYSGIEVSNISQATIGSDIAGKTNTFDNLEMGIINTNSNLTVYNNTFNRINSTNSQLGRCISSTNSDVPAAEKLLIVGGSANSYQTNTFTNSYMGTYCSYNQDVSAVLNKFNKINHTGIYLFLCSAPNNSVFVLNNTLDDCVRSIFSTGCGGSLNLEISNNFINPTGTAVPNSIGISVLNNSLSTSGTAPTFNIINNTIKGVSLGIQVTNFTMPNIRDNTITLSDLGGNESNGILVTTSPSSDIEHNLVKGPSSASQNSWWMNGIRLESSANSKIIYNGVEDIGRGLFFGGSNAGTQTAKNNMKNTYNGMVLNWGMIGYQLGSPSACKAAENTWQGTVPAGGSNIFSYNSDGTQSAMNLLLNSNPAWTADMKAPWNIVSTFSGSGPTVSSVPTYTCNITSGYTGGHRRGTEIQNIAHDQLLKLAKDKINFPVNDASAKWWAKYNLYNQLQTDLTLQDEEPELKAFAANFATGNIGKLYRLNESLDKGDLTTALASTNNLISQNAIEQNLKEVYSIAIANRKSSALSAVEIKKLQAIARLCPYESGPAVYNARVLLATIDNIVYANSCEIPPFGNVKARSMEEDKNKNISVGNTEEVSVYPNPANDKLNVTIHLEQGQTALLTVFDLTGKLILSTVLSGTATILETSTAGLSEGIYIYKLKVSGVPIKSGKLSIIH